MMHGPINVRLAQSVCVRDMNKKFQHLSEENRKNCYLIYCLLFNFVTDVFLIEHLVQICYASYGAFFDV